MWNLLVSIFEAIFGRGLTLQEKFQIAQSKMDLDYHRYNPSPIKINQGDNHAAEEFKQLEEEPGLPARPEEHLRVAFPTFSFDFSPIAKGSLTAGASWKSARVSCTSDAIRFCNSSD